MQACSKGVVKGMVAAAALISTSVLFADNADRNDVLERIKPVGQVSTAAAPAKAAAPAAQVKAEVAVPAPAAAPVPAASGSEGAALFVSKGCGACHGADGKTAIMPTYPKIAGQRKGYLVAQMKDIKSGARNNAQSAIMKGIVAGVSDEEMEKIAAWLESGK